MKGSKTFAKVVLSCLTAVSCAFTMSACGGSSATTDGWGSVYTNETAYAEAQSLGYSGTLEEFMASIKGADGVGISNIVLTEDNEIVVTLTDNTVHNLGAIDITCDKKTVTGAYIDSNGNLILKYSDNTTSNIGKVTGSDGEDGEDLSIYDIYAAVKAETNDSDLTFSDFVKEYFDYSNEELEQVTSLQATINRSLLSAVSIITKFTKVTTSYTPYPHTETSTASYAGSGMILSVDKDAGDMYVVTNSHVVYVSSATGDGYCDDISLYLYGEEFLSDNKISAEIVGVAKNYDLAVLKVTGSDVVKNSSAIAAEWCTDEEVYVGETVYAVGNPEGAKLSATQGIVSKDSETLTIDLEDTTSTSDDYTYRVLRTDTAINGGNSGGPLFNTDGKVIGIVNAKSVSSSIDNMGYALPAATCRRVVQNILDNYSGAETHGISVAQLDATTAVKSSTAKYNEKLSVTEIIEEIYVSAVNASSIFYGSLQVNDVISNIKVTASDGTVREDLAITRSHNLTDAMLSVRVGDTVTLTVTRGTQKVTISKTYTSAYMSTLV